MWKYIYIYIYIVSSHYFSHYFYTCVTYCYFSFYFNILKCHFCHIHIILIDNNLLKLLFTFTANTFYNITGSTSFTLILFRGFTLIRLEDYQDKHFRISRTMTIKVTLLYLKFKDSWGKLVILNASLWAKNDKHWINSFKTLKKSSKSYYTYSILFFNYWWELCWDHSYCCFIAQTHQPRTKCFIQWTFTCLSVWVESFRLYNKVFLFGL